MHARVDLQKTNYNLHDICNIGIVARLERQFDVTDLLQVYNAYCKYKQFSSVMPLFEEEFFYPQSDVFTYYDNKTLVGFTLMFRYNTNSVAAAQFAWTYHKPKIRLGICSLHYICAYYKEQGFRHLYLGDAAKYKQSLDGFEICGPI